MTCYDYSIADCLLFACLLFWDLWQKLRGCSLRQADAESIQRQVELEADIQHKEDS